MGPYRKPIYVFIYTHILCFYLYLYIITFSLYGVSAIHVPVNELLLQVT